MKLYAISDIHLAFKENKIALEKIKNYPDDWLILAGDIGESPEIFQFALKILTRRFAKVVWVPGNHDLWTLPQNKLRIVGEQKYFQLVEICRKYDVLTPEDPYALWPGKGEYIIAPTFTLYDYSYRPDEVPEEDVMRWAMESGVMCKDETVLSTDPYPDKPSWCAQRCQYTEQRLQELGKKIPIIIINHFPLKYEFAQRLFAIPRFSIWCGTTRTENWFKIFPIAISVYGHLHIRSTDYIDGVRFEEVSLGYPRQWNLGKPIDHYLREILPGKAI